jgi:hypothetical protein
MASTSAAATTPAIAPGDFRVGRTIKQSFGVFFRNLPKFFLATAIIGLPSLVLMLLGDLTVQSGLVETRGENAAGYSYGFSVAGSQSTLGTLGVIWSLIAYKPSCCSAHSKPCATGISPSAKPFAGAFLACCLSLDYSSAWALPA